MTTYFSIANISNYMFTTRPLWRDLYYVNWYTHTMQWL